MTYIPQQLPNATVADFSGFYPKVLLHCEGSNGSQTLTDSSFYSKNYTATGATISTSQYKYGTSSLYFNGTTSYKVPLDNSLEMLYLGSKDFTIEMWFHLTQINVGYQALLAASNTSDQQGPLLFIDNSSLVFAWAKHNTTGWVASIGAAGVTANQWHHVAIVRDTANTALKIYYNGNLQQTNPMLSTFLMRSSTNWNIGNYDYFPGGQKSMYGYIDDFCISIGNAKYNADFTPGPVSDPTYPSGTFEGDLKQDITGAPYLCTNATSPIWKPIRYTTFTGMP